MGRRSQECEPLARARGGQYRGQYSRLLRFQYLCVAQIGALKRDKVDIQGENEKIAQALTKAEQTVSSASSPCTLCQRHPVAQGVGERETKRRGQERAPRALARRCSLDGRNCCVLYFQC